MTDRRHFLATLAGAAAALSLPKQMFAQAAQMESAPAMPEASLPEEQYWAAVRRQFEIPADEIYLNNGTCGSSPYPVLKAVFDSYNRLEQMDDADPEQYPLFGYGAFNQFREPLAKFINASKDEVAIVRNATEANAIMANGLDLNAGDEVLMSDQEHPSGLGPWQMRAKRYGIVVKQFEIPVPPKSPSEILERVSAGITLRTKVIFVSHITTTTGVVLPVKEICSLARTKGIVSMVDGAQVAGMMPIDVKAIGCDMYG
ncbi:MAG: aminotransferase class V-fold PLP-dependent enzyme, partial [Acidobacteriaceae bacterium]